MFIPIGDSPNARGLPAVTLALIAVNVAVYLLVTLPLGSTAPARGDPLLREYAEFLARVVDNRAALLAALRETSAYDLVVFRWGYRSDAPSLATLLSSMFLHGGFMHLAGNMLFLWVYGDNVEHRMGSLRFLAWYLLTGAAGTFSHALLTSGPPVPLVGASGAISGVLGFYFVWFPRNAVRMLIFLFPFLVTTVMLPARLVLGFYLVMDNLLPLFLAGGGAVAYGAHIGGFIAGAAVAWWHGGRARP